MESIRKQASKFRDHVAKQQQDILKQFSGRFSHDSPLSEDVEYQCNEKLQKLYNSTRAAKRFQRDIVRGVGGLVSANLKQKEIVTKLAEDCSKYGNEHENSGFPLARASREFGTSHHLMEKEREVLLHILGDQVFEPLRAMITGAPLEDARLLTKRYERMRKDMEAKTVEVLKRQLKFKEAGANAEGDLKLQSEEAKLLELKTTTSALGREATAAMMSVEAQQQQITFQRLVSMVDAERSYHHSVAAILDKLHDEMVQMEKYSESASELTTLATLHSQNANDEFQSSNSDDLALNGQTEMYCIAEVIHPFDAQNDGELSLSTGDFVIVRQVGPDGWSEGECKGKVGWFPSAYVEQRDKVPAK